MNEIKFVLRLADGRWVSAPTNTATANPHRAGGFTATDEESAADLRQAMERLHGPLELVLWQRKRADALKLQDPFGGAEVIYAYTRTDALADGAQINVSEIARDAGLKFPVYLTRAVWENYVRVRDGVRCQDEKGRLWDDRVDAALRGTSHERPAVDVQAPPPKRQPRPDAAAGAREGRLWSAGHRRSDACHHNPHAG